MWVATDESGRVNCVTDKKEYAAPNAIEIDMPEGYDASRIWDYRLENGAIIEDPKGKTDEQIAMERSERMAAQIPSVISLFVATADITDAQALTVSAFYDDWKFTDENGNPIHYSEGDRRNFDGYLYRCNEGHDAQESWNPADAHSLWTRIVPEGETPEWEQPVPGIFDGYEKGQHVMHNGTEYESTFDGLNVWEPGVVGEEYWKVVG